MTQPVGKKINRNKLHMTEMMEMTRKNALTVEYKPYK